MGKHRAVLPVCAWGSRAAPVSDPLGRSSGSAGCLSSGSLTTEGTSGQSPLSGVVLPRVRRDAAGAGASLSSPPPPALLLFPPVYGCVSFQLWVGWFTLLKSRKNKADFFAVGNRKPFYEKVHPYQRDSLWLVRREKPQSHQTFSSW